MYKYMCRKVCQGFGDVDYIIDLVEIIYEVKEMKGGLVVIMLDLFKFMIQCFMNQINVYYSDVLNKQDMDDF